MAGKLQVTPVPHEKAAEAVLAANSFVTTAAAMIAARQSATHRNIAVKSTALAGPFIGITLLPLRLEPGP
jgi:hypothetical protein